MPWEWEVILYLPRRGRQPLAAIFSNPYAALAHADALDGWQRVSIDLEGCLPMRISSPSIAQAVGQAKLSFSCPTLPVIHHQLPFSVMPFAPNTS